MSYSNIKKDKVQAGPGRVVKTVFLTLGLTTLAISASVNVYNQWTTLRQAADRNFEVEMNIKKVEEENKILTRQLEYATSSASLARKSREILGLGGKSDTWLKMPSGEQNMELKPEINEVIEKPVIIQWRDLFWR